MLMNTYIINLPNDNIRLQEILIETSKNGIVNPIIVEGVDIRGSGVPKSLQKYVSSILNNILSKSAIGCGLAHINAWETMIKNGDDYALILEDDITFVDNFKTQFNSILPTVPSDFYMLYISCFYGCDITKRYKELTFPNRYRKKVLKINEHVYTPASPLAMHSYILSNKGAKYLLKWFEEHKIQTHIDIQIKEALYNMPTYAINPNLTLQKTMGMLNSNNTINKYPHIINNIAKNYTDSYGVPLSYKLTISEYEIIDVPLNTYALTWFILGGIFAYKKMSLKTMVTIFTVFHIIEVSVTHVVDWMFIKTFTIMFCAYTFGYTLFLIY